MILGPLFLPGARPPPDPLRPQGLSVFVFAKYPARAALLMQGSTRAPSRSLPGVLVVEWIGLIISNLRHSTRAKMEGSIFVIN